MDNLMKMIKNGEMPKEFYKKLADDFKPEPPKNSRMRFSFDTPFKGGLYAPSDAYSLTVTEYADICEGETLTAKSVCCADAIRVIKKGLIPFKSRTVAFIENQLREQFESLDSFMRFCDENKIPYKEQPLWVDEHSFNEYTGEHRGEYAPFARASKESEDKNL